jgi:hypothetical protein
MGSAAETIKTLARFVKYKIFNLTSYNGCMGISRPLISLIKMAEKIYRCIKCGVVPEAEVEFGDQNEGPIVNDPKQDVRFVEGTTAQSRWHKNCGQPVEIE